ncbi:acyltransferase [Dyadobacter sp. CY326]|uniref:acyltransferase family protein n=1 Tax=Dyadobacter sp. CY326 TaxID=2907300 RepID=UPI001F1B165D|nr:acyltransferase [Dyadobacter sp. CY326]MCE7063865.1 acyltransferase [Dyadobacter sp. CY326]
MSYKRGHVRSLDGIRGVAILLVMGFHCLEYSKVTLVKSISAIGWVGVDLFFVLSGFLITGILLDTKKRDNYFTAFMAKRALRIFPLYYLCLLAVFLAISIPSVVSFNPIFDKRHFESVGYYLTFTQNLYFSYTGWGVTDILNHFWSLAVEEQFYLFWPVVIYYFNKSQVLLICAGLIATSLIVRNLHVNSDFSYVFTFARVDALSIGAITAILVRAYQSVLNRIAVPIFLASLVTLILMSIDSDSLHFRNAYFVRAGYTIFALMFGAIVTFVFDQGKIGSFTNRVLSLSFLTFFGKYSYGLYVYHWLLYKGIYLLLKARYGFSELWIIPFFMIVVLVSVISFHTFEAFFLRFKSRLEPLPKPVLVSPTMM